MDQLQKLRDYFGVPLIVTSAYRTPEHNRSIKGAAPASRHMLGIAFDVSVVNVDPDEAEMQARALGFYGIGRYALSRFIHIDARPRSERATWGDDWPPQADRFDETTERPDGVEGMLRRLKRRLIARFLAWFGAGGSIAVVAEYATDAVSTVGDFLRGLSMPDMPTLTATSIIWIVAIPLVAYLLWHWRRNQRKDPSHGIPDHSIGRPQDKGRQDGRTDPVARPPVHDGGGTVAHRRGGGSLRPPAGGWPPGDG